ncbi:phosphatidate cytidylyltransferase [Pseudaeromonas paramecii]|uniref:Phosphatidate cytidylyltransferase n=1 Tax=Pseudaeromonas paramecii TaxID=2138166 RepID=A0ABP8Q3I7_9GAMM
MRQRIITALVLVILVLGWIFWLPEPFFLGGAVLIYLMASREWARFTPGYPRWLIPLCYGLLLAGSLFVLAPLSQAQRQANPWLWLILSLGGLWWLLALFMVLRYPAATRWWRGKNGVKGLFGVLTLLPFFWALVLLRGAAPGWQGGLILLFVMALVWCADSGAYFVGRQWGRHKMLPRVSPNKTLEGLLGGLIIAGALAVVVPLWAGFPLVQALGILLCSLLAMLASVLGDLSESLFKREVGIKDSGTLLPGHGGVLDRVDSLTAALPIFVLCYLLIN